MKVIILIFVAVFFVSAQHYERLITKSELQNLIKKDKDFLIVDARSKASYDKGHINLAIHQYVKDKTWNPLLVARSKSGLIIVYCSSEGCMYSDVLAFKLEKKGFSNVKVYRGGYKDWLTVNNKIKKHAKNN